jgi:uncharacterized membrane protein YebE (DUF533 family)
MFDAKNLLDALVTASQSPSANQPSSASGQPAGAADLGATLSSVLGQLTGQGAAQPGAAGSAGAAGGLGSIIGAVLGQATQGLQGAGRDLNAATGVGNQLDGLLASLTGGKGAGDLLAQAKDLAANNQLATGAALGSLASLFLGTKAGRGLAVDTAKLGGLAMIGGLAYQAWQNYQAGKPPIAIGQAQAPAEPPAASPFGSLGTPKQDNETAELLLRAMIAAASADGTIDAEERARITGNLQALGADPEAARFLDHQFRTPATAAQLADAVPGPEAAVQVYTAARLTIDPDTKQEKAFLADLADKLGLDAKLVAHIDAAAESVKAPA